MKKNPIKLLAAFILGIALVSCNSYGHKVTFDNTKGEVYYKGDSVTEIDAKAVGKLLIDNGYFINDEKTRTVQIIKDGGRIKARFVVNIKAIDTVTNADKVFELLGATMTKEVFNNIPVDIILTDRYFKDIKTIPYSPAQLSTVNLTEEIQQMDKKDYHNNTLYYSKNIPAVMTDSIYNHLVSAGFFETDGSVDLIISLRQNGSYYIRFPIKPSSNNPAGLQNIDDFGKELKQNVFVNDSLELEVIDQNMNSVKTFTY